MPKPFHCSLVTPERSVFEAEVIYANLPAHDGQRGVLAHHAPLVTELGRGQLSLEMPDGAVKRFDLSGGFAQVHNDKLTLLSERAEERSGQPA